MRTSLSSHKIGRLRVKVTAKETEIFFPGHTKGNPVDCGILDSTKAEYFKNKGDASSVEGYW